MFTKIALAAALVIGPISVSQAASNGDNGAAASSRHARASYAQQVQPNAAVNPSSTESKATGEGRFEKNWFDWENQQ